MTPSNVPSDSQEGKNTAKEIKKYNIHGLLKDGIARKFWDPMRGSDFDQYKKNKDANHDAIRLNMRDIRNENREDWGEITDTMIDTEAQDDQISEMVINMSKNLVLRRKRVFDRTVELFPTIKAQRSDWRNILDVAISSYSEDELQNLIHRSASLRKMTYDIFPWLRGINTTEKKDFDKIFSDKNTYFDVNSKPRLERIHRDYFRHDTIPDRSDIDFLLWVYKNAPDKRKKELLVAFGVSMTFEHATELWLINTDFLETLAEREFAGAYDRLTPEQKKSFVRWLAYNTSHSLSATDMQDSAIWSIFSNEQKRSILAQEVSRSVALDMPEKEQWEEDTILKKIRDRKKKESESANREEQDHDIYDEFIQELDSLKKWDWVTPNPIENRELLKQKDAVLQFQHQNGSTQYIRITRVRGDDNNPLEIDNGMGYGIEFETLNVTDRKLWTPTRATVSYALFQKFLSGHDHLKALSAATFETLLTKDMTEVGEWKDKIYDARTIELEAVTASNIASKLDIIDWEWSRYGFEAGTAFMAPLQDSETGKNDPQGGIWTVKKIHGNMVDIADPWGNISEKDIPIDSLYQLLKENTLFKRIAKISDDAQMSEELKLFGVDAIKDGDMYIKQKDDHGHDSEKKVTCFQSEKWWHIRMKYMKDGVVRFWEYDSDTEISKVKEYAKKNGLDKKVKGLYTWRSMSYPAFLKYLEKDKYKASTKDKIIVEPAAHDLHGDEHGHHPHVHGSLMSRIFQMQNPASIWKGFEMIMHGIEHTLEKWAKLDAAKFALKTAKFLHLPDSVEAQIYADVVSGSKEIVEKYEKKIFDLPGPRGRLKCLHIIENHDSRPEEIMSAMNYMLKSYGHLYAEDIRHKQSIVYSKEQCIAAPKGTFMFFDAFVSSAGLGNLSHWRKEAYEKAIGEMGSEEDHEWEPTEEQLIHGLFKMIDGKWDEFPYAASVVKAVGGPGGFEKNWKMEGYENAKKKWNDQTKMVSAQGRLNKAVGYLNTHEIYKWVGAMEAVVDKVKVPKFQAFPFIWAVGWFSRYASHAALQDIKWFAEKGYSFHAYAFMRTPEDNMAYKKVVRLALESKGGEELVNKFDAICKRLEFNPDNAKYTKNAASDMMQFWQTHCDGDDGLHDKLQWHNGWLIKKARDGNTDAKQYMKVILSKHEMQLDSPTIGWDRATDYYNEWWYRMNRIMATDEETGLLSMRRTLNKIKLQGTKSGDREMSDDDYKKLWGGVSEQMTSIRDPKFFDNDIDLQKEQFRVYRKEIIDFYVTKLNARTQQLDTKSIEQLLSLPSKYWWDIKAMGIDPHSIFDQVLEKNGFEDDYNRWKDGRVYSEWRSTASANVLDLAGLVQGRTAQATRSVWGEGSTLRRDRTVNRLPTDDDADMPGGAADLGENN